MAHAIARYLFRVIGPGRSVGTRPLRTVRALVRVRAVADVPRITQPVARAGVRAGAEALPGFDNNADEEEELAHRSSGAAHSGYRRGCLGRWLSVMVIGFVPDTASTALRGPGTHSAVTSGSQRLSG